MTDSVECALLPQARVPEAVRWELKCFCPSGAGQRGSDIASAADTYLSGLAVISTCSTSWAFRLFVMAVVAMDQTNDQSVFMR